MAMLKEQRKPTMCGERDLCYTSNSLCETVHLANSLGLKTFVAKQEVLAQAGYF